MYWNKFKFNELQLYLLITMFLVLWFYKRKLNKTIYTKNYFYYSALQTNLYMSNVDYCSLLTKYANWWLLKGISSYFTKYPKNSCWQFQIESVAMNIDSLLLYSSLAITKSFFKFVTSKKSFLMPDHEKIFEIKGSCQDQKLMYLHRKKKIHCEIRGFRE